MNLFDKYSNVLKFNDNEIHYAKKILEKNSVDFSKKIVCLNVRDQLI